MRVALNHAAADGPARIRTWDQRIMSSLPAPDWPRRGEIIWLSERDSHRTPLKLILADLGGSCCHPVVTLGGQSSRAGKALLVSQ
jgi:hypothetical protein